MIEIIKNDKVLQMLLIAFMACVAYWVFIIRVPRRIFKEIEREKHDEAKEYVYQQKCLLHKSINLDELYKEKKAIDSFTPEARRLPVIRRPNFQARRLRNNRAGFYNRLPHISNLIRDELHLLNEQGSERR